MGRLAIRLSVSCIASKLAKLSTLSDLTLKCSIDGDVVNRNPVGSTLDACTAALTIDPAPPEGLSMECHVQRHWLHMLQLLQGQLSP